MSQQDTKAVRDRLAEGVFQRMRADVARVPPKVAIIVEYIADHLFDPQLHVKGMFRELGIRDHNRMSLFSRHVGATPAAYIREGQLEVAIELLRETGLDIGTIATTLGFRWQGSFTLAFKRWSGQTPRWFRRHSQGRNQGASAALREPTVVHGPGAWQRFESGRLTDEESVLVLKKLLTAYPAARRLALDQWLLDNSRVGSEPSSDSLETAERVMALAAWRDLSALPPEAQLERVRYATLRTPALTELLREQSLAAGRQDAQRGIHVARLALHAAVQLEGAGDEDDGCAIQTALSWMCLGNAKRIAGDPAGADQALRVAEVRLPASPSSPRDAMAVAELHKLLAMLRLWQSRHDEALQSAVSALRRFRELGQPRCEAQTLIICGQCHYECRRLPEATAQYELALEVLRKEPDDYLSCVATFELAHCYFDLDSLAKAQQCLEAARLFVTQVPAAGNAWAVSWLDSRVAARQGQLRTAALALERTITALRDGGKHGHLAVALLDLAVIRAEQGLRAKGAELASESLEALDACRLPTETQVGRALVADAVASGAFDAAHLSELRCALVAALMRTGVIASRGIPRQ